MGTEFDTHGLVSCEHRESVERNIKGLDVVHPGTNAMEAVWMNTKLPCNLERFLVSVFLVRRGLGSHVGATL